MELKLGSTKYRYCKSSQYKYVDIYKAIDPTNPQQFVYKTQLYNPKLGFKHFGKTFTKEREAAKAVDIHRIGVGLEPVNVLTRLTPRK